MAGSLAWDDGPMGTHVGRALARAALAGNPSDVFGGAVLATPVPGLEAVVRVSDGDGIVVGDRSWPSPGDVAGPHGGEGALLAATVERLATWCRTDGPGEPADGFELTWSTSIPRSVGLAGSSALVVAAIRALAARWDLDLDVTTTARLALEVETDLLGIAAGPQDRLVQACGATVLMDFGGPAWANERVDPPAPVPLFVVWAPGTASTSHGVHGPLRDRGDEPAVRAAVAELARHAHDAAAALRAGDLAALGAAMDGSFDVRASIVDLHPAHVALIEGARACGAPVNYTGSGGAVVGLVPEPNVLSAVERWTAESALDLVTFELPPGPPTGGPGR
jgi:glucuronokinase